jgi:cellulose 1,4-beta-cellobiosidase
LSWSASPNATGYNIKRSASANGTYNIIAASFPALTFTNTGLADGTPYYFVVSAINAAGVSANSSPVSAQPVSLTPPQLNFGISGAQMQFSWPQDHTGWNLEVQTNSLIGTNWVMVPNSTFTNQFLFPIDPASGSVFFRLVY